MRSWPFVIAVCVLFVINMLRLGSDNTLRIWNDPVCATVFTGYLICVAIALAARTPTPPAGP